MSYRSTDTYPTGKSIVLEGRGFAFELGTGELVRFFLEGYGTPNFRVFAGDSPGPGDEPMWITENQSSVMRPIEKDSAEALEYMSLGWHWLFTLPGDERQWHTELLEGLPSHRRKKPEWAR